VRQALIEGFALSAAGAALSLVIAISSVEPLSRFFPDEAEAPMTLDLAPDWRVLGYVILLAFVSTLAFAIPPALKASRWDVWRSLRANEAAVAGGGSRLRAALTVAQVALCFVLLAGSGLLMRSLYLLESVDTGLTAGQVTLATLDAELSRSDGRAKGIDELDPDARRLYEDEMRRLYEGIAQRAAAIPGVDGAALAATVPLLGWSYSLGKLHGGEVAEEGAFAATGNIVTPDYFKTMEIPILQGRLFSPADGARTSRVAIVSETLARRLWPAGDAVGQVLYVGGSAEENGRHVIGVARDVPHDLQENQNELYYVPHQQQTASRMILHVRSSMDLAVLLPAMRSAVAEVDPRLPLFNVRTLQAVKLESYWQQRMAAVIVGFSAVLAVLLAAIGLYAVMASRVTQRSREIGIRMALGASADRIRRGVIWESSRLCLIGVAVGGALAFAGTQALASLLYGVTPTDLLTFATVFAILTLVTVAASYLPARRATSVNPVNALRSE
jgi:predicted permease